MRKEFLVNIILFLGGIWIAQLIGKDYFATYGYLNSVHIERFVQEEMNYVDLFWNILWTRGKQFLMIWMLQMTACKRILPILLKLLFAFLLGFLLMVCCITVGPTGLLVVLATLFPHGICYFLAVWGLFGWQQTMRFEKRQRVKEIVIQIVICMLLIISGGILETVVGTRMLRYILKVSKY